MRGGAASLLTALAVLLASWHAAALAPSGGPVRAPAAPLLLVELRRAPPPAPVKSFKDCPQCPEMVWLAPGSFILGTPDDERGRHTDEGPRKRVEIARPLAFSRYEVTFAEWDACVAAGGCGGHRPADQGWGRGRQPVVNVSWDDAHAYADWLSKTTGKRYRLPSESEWVYAARAGSQTSRFWGEDPEEACDYANVYDRTGARKLAAGQQRHTCDDEHSTPSPVGSFRPNAFGLSDMTGNLWEWVEDCWRSRYYDHKRDGSPVEGEDCKIRAVRGGDWLSMPSYARVGIRSGEKPEHRREYLGIRLVREE